MPPKQPALLFVVFVLCGLASALSNRSMDPLLTLISRDFEIPITTAALLSSAYGFSYAFSQPILGPIGDFYGKTRVLRACLWLLTLCIGGMTLAQSFGLVLTFRLVGGVAAGGIVPVTLAILGDKYPPAERQLAIGRFLTAGLTGIIIGASAAGVMAVTFGWRSFFYLAGAVSLTAAIGATLMLREAPSGKPAGHIRISDAVASYGSVFRNPKSWFCFSTVFLEGVSLYGATPYIGELLEQNHLGSAREAGFVLAGIGLGGILYSATLPIQLRLFRRTRMMAIGGCLAIAGLVGMAMAAAWPVMTLGFTVTGFAFMMLHNSVQAEVAELSTTARASAFSMHSFSFFLGQAIGPILFGFGLHTVGRGWLVLNMLILAATGLTVARLFARHPSASGRL